MRVYQAELKRILKTRSVQILLAAAVLISAVLAYFPCTFAEYVYEDEAGQEVTLTGRKAIRMIQERQGQYEGEITEEKLADAVRQYGEFASRYEGELPNGIYDERVTAVDSYRYVFAINRLLTRMQEVNADPDTGIAPGMEALTEEDAQNFYEQCRQHVKELIYLENGHGAKGDSAVAQAEMLYDKVQMPFSYYPYISTNAIEYTGLCVLFLVLIGMILMVPLFASDRQTQADQIIKCTKYGKRRLASVRILAGVTVATVMYAAGITLFLLVMNSLIGWESLKSSVQITVSAVVFLPVTVGGLEVIIAAAGKAAHLGGVIAAYTTLPVIGVPIKTSMMGGLDSLLSMVQMPKGIPVACVAVDGADNAAILAAQMLALEDAALAEKLTQFKADMAAEVAAKDEKVRAQFA